MTSCAVQGVHDHDYGDLGYTDAYTPTYSGLPIVHYIHKHKILYYVACGDYDHVQTIVRLKPFAHIRKYIPVSMYLMSYL